MPAMTSAQLEDQFFNHRGPPSPEVPGVNTNVPLPAQPSGILERGSQAATEMMRGLGAEGPLGMLDPAGTRDRARAREELRRKFDIVPDNHQGARLPNQVTNAEYEDVVRQYSDIRLNRADLKVDGSGSANPRQFQADAMDDIGDIMQTAAGRQLIAQLSNNKQTDASGATNARTTTITPSLFQGTTTPNTGNAYEQAIDAAGQPLGSVPGLGAPFANGSPGVGSNTQVKINPNLDVQGFDPLTGTMSTFRSDVAMFHELTHALHDTRGTTDTSNVSATDAAPGGTPHPGFANDAQRPIRRWEHQAIGLGIHANNPVSENVYRRERRLLGNTQAALPGDTLMHDREYFLQQQSYNDMFGR